MKFFPIVVLSSFLIGVSCTNEQPSTDPIAITEIKPETVNYGNLSTYDVDGNVQVVIEIPAGTNKKREYNYATNSFPIDQKNGKDRVVNFMPYPGNYGFIPSTIMDTARGGDGDALDVLILGESLPTGSTQMVIPVAMMELLDGGEIDNKILAVPADGSLQIITATTFEEMKTDYPVILHMIEDWFANYKGAGVMEFVGWKDEKAARADIEKWSILTK